MGQTTTGEGTHAGDRRNVLQLDWGDGGVTVNARTPSNCMLKRSQSYGAYTL